MSKHHIAQLPGYNLLKPIPMLVSQGQEEGCFSHYRPYQAEAPAFKACGQGNTEQKAIENLKRDIVAVINTIQHYYLAGWRLPNILSEVPKYIERYITKDTYRAI